MIQVGDRHHSDALSRSKATLDLFPPPSLKTELFRQRYHLIHQRVLRNESFQKATVGAKTTEWKITPIANLLGRSGTGHLILGLLTIAPTGTLAISDLSGTISLDLDQATSIDAVETWLCPGMIVLVDGVYEEEYSSAGGNLGGTGGIGGTIGGRLTGFSVGAPRCEMRAATLGITDAGNIDSQTEHHIGGGFGWVDFLGIGSERAIGSRMRKIEQRLLRPRAPQSLNASLSSQAHEHANSNKMVILGEVNLDNAICLMALRRILLTYAPPLSSTAVPPPITFVLLGNFVSHAAMSNTASSSTSSATTIPDSITYKESFDALAALLSDFPGLLHSSIWIFVPGDNDPWASAFSSGASVPLPRNAIPDMFTTRVKRAFATANAAPGAALGATSKDRVQGEAVWTTNPARLSLFGTSNEIVLFRDDISGRLRRTSVPLKPSGEAEDEGYGSDERNRQDQRREEVSSTMMSGALDNEDAMDIDGNAHAADDDVVVIDADTPVTTATRKAGPSSTVRHARSLTKTLLDQAHLSPFPLATRPLHWSYAHSLSLYPLPSALVLCDTDADAFVVKYQGCCVMNAGRILGGRGGAGKGGKRGGREISWIEYDVLDRNAEIRYGDL
jgi:DNA polymerase epsilon subunit 2